MIKELLRITSRFTITLLLFAAATVHTIMYAVPEVSRPGAVAASIVAALLIAMFDMGVFHVDVESDLHMH